MLSPLTSVTIYSYMESFELHVICFGSQADSTMIQTCGHLLYEHQGLLHHLNGIYPNINLIRELEQNMALPFLDVLVSRTVGSLQDLSLTSHKVKMPSIIETGGTELMLNLANTVILCTESCGNHDHILLSQDS